MSNNLLTAKEIAKNKIEEILDGNLRGDWTFSCNHIKEEDGLCKKRCNGFCEEYEKLVQQLSEDKVEFAKFHVKAALEKASSEAEVDVEVIMGQRTRCVSVDKDSILNAYPENLIQ